MNCLKTIDRFRATHQSFGPIRQISALCSLKVIFFIWIMGLAITLPWAIVFQVVLVDHSPGGSLDDDIVSLPFCLEIWQHAAHGNVYFLVVHIFACFILPFILIMVFNFAMWRQVLSFNKKTSISLQNISQYPDRLQLIKIRQKRNLRMLKLFNGLTFAFFAFWLPMYVITVRVRFFYSEANPGSEFERNLVYSLIPVSQLLGSCNSCVNPVLYAILSPVFKKYLTPKCFTRFSRTKDLDSGSNNAASQLQEGM